MDIILLREVHRLPRSPPSAYSQWVEIFQYSMINRFTIWFHKVETPDEMYYSVQIVLEATVFTLWRHGNGKIFSYPYRVALCFWEMRARVLWENNFHRKLNWVDVPLSFDNWLRFFLSLFTPLLKLPQRPKRVLYTIKAFYGMLQNNICRMNLPCVSHFIVATVLEQFLHSELLFNEPREFLCNSITLILFLIPPIPVFFRGPSHFSKKIVFLEEHYAFSPRLGNIMILATSCRCIVIFQRAKSPRVCISQCKGVFPLSVSACRKGRQTTVSLT